jgi:hypothetical protein
MSQRTPSRAALDAVDHELGEQLLVREAVVGADVEHVYVALANTERRPTVRRQSEVGPPPTRRHR